MIFLLGIAFVFVQSIEHRSEYAECARCLRGRNTSTLSLMFPFSHIQVATLHSRARTFNRKRFHALADFLDDDSACYDRWMVMSASANRLLGSYRGCVFGPDDELGVLCDQDGFGEFLQTNEQLRPAVRSLLANSETRYDHKAAAQHLIRPYCTWFETEREMECPLPRDRFD